MKRRFLLTLTLWTTLSAVAETPTSVWKPQCWAHFGMLSRRLDLLKHRHDPALLGKDLTPDEVTAIGQYTGSHSAYLNPHLRRLWWEPDYAEHWAKEVSPEYQKIAADIVSGLSKLPAWEGTSYRGARIRPEKLATYAVGEIINETSFFSTSQELSQAFSTSDLTDGGVLFEVRGKRGRYIKHLSPGHASEEEVLFQPFTNYRVVERGETLHKGATVTKIVLEEIVPKDGR